MERALTEPTYWRPTERTAVAPPALLASVRQLMILRWIALGGQAAAVIVSSALDVALPVVPMAAVIGSLIALNGLTSLRLRHGGAARHDEVAALLMFDLAAFTLLLYLSGGATNPFSTIYVLHVVVMALLLPPVPVVVGTSIVLACYSLVARYHVSLRDGAGGPVASDLLAVGEWLSLALTAAVVAWFVVRIVAALHRHERLLREATRKAQDDESILKLGALAAGAAHELATPITTIGVVAGEIARAADTPSLRRDAGILASQVDACRQALSTLLAAASHARAEGGGLTRLDAFVESLAQRFRMARPDVEFGCRSEHGWTVPEIYADKALEQSVLALLHNAADASPGDVSMTARWNEASLRLLVADRGAGVPESDLDKLGRVFFTTKPRGRGMGLGLVVAATAVRQLGGTLRWTSRPGGGLQAEILLPLASLGSPEAKP
jgi:two-component system sensor histidine kinase RegB